ncbi:hypothetical protein I302_105534 [Kwoniella bestiolae CBS 10118]|uniref:Mesaconyl-C4 CoA hydratase n=1 Tax=Kwoniella bestiolae CBS 10118 TaxID=1296100 RepID=A0A1B9FTE5_9TREE|nr:hypothetical protein I302_08817 [Kwoniella bestiolae CBS 10118]OCF22036.1 hypothetical protein I302_08817 [Kwoniella bestiolae CBS 10118]
MKFRYIRSIHAHPITRPRSNVLTTSRANRVATSRAYSSSSPRSPSIQDWIGALTNLPPKYDYDTLDPERLSQLRRVLPTRQSGEYLEDLREGTEVDPASHWVLFRPKPMLRDLGLDGTSTEYNAPSPYTRRMWAGGSIEWSASNCPLRVGERVTQIVNVPKVEYKKDMIFVNQQLRIYPGTVSQDCQNQGDSWSIREIRTHVFRKESPMSTTPLKPNDIGPEKALGETLSELDNPDISFTYTPTSPLLFLYSALTHNPHKVHYDHPWTTTKEGHPRPLVHGPLTATLLIELANLNRPSPGKKLREFRYRATSPMVIDDPIQLVGRYTKDQQGVDLWAVQSGKVGMKASAHYH